MLQSVLPFSKKQRSLYVAVSKYYFRDQSYITRIQLAVLDHKNHLKRQNAKNKEGELMYAQKFRKQTRDSCQGMQEVQLHPRFAEGD